MRKTVFCIDRNPVDLQCVQSILDSRYTVVCMSDATLALRQILTIQPDLILLGTDTNGMGSMELVSHLAKSEPRLLNKLIVLTDDKQLAEAKLLTSEGACAMVQKPLIHDELIFTVQAMFARLSSSVLSSRQLHEHYMRAEVKPVSAVVAKQELP